MKQAIIGTFYKTLKLAQRKLREKERIFGKDKFALMKHKDGFIVVSLKQLSDISTYK